MSLERRLSKLEKQLQAGDDGPAYVSIEDLAELEELAPARPVKVYIGVNPDTDWPAPAADQDAAR